MALHRSSCPGSLDEPMDPADEVMFGQKMMCCGDQHQPGCVAKACVRFQSITVTGLKTCCCFFHLKINNARERRAGKHWTEKILAM